LYEDENDNYDYEKGIYSTVTLTWDDAKKELTISDVKGFFPGMLKTRTFQVVAVSPNHGAGLEATDRIEKVVTYTGTEKKVVF
jgi:alpha-D-xyloside xylohydrolase